MLQPWGVIEGTLYLNGLSASNQSVSVHGCQKSDADPRLLFSFDYRTTTDDRGHFRFNQVLPGKHLIARDVAFSGGGPGIVNHSHAALVKVESGIVASVELRRQGRPVVGRIVFDGSPDEVHWGMSQAFLQAEGVKPPQLDYERAPAESAQASFLHQAQTRFPFTLSKSGDIRADDVPPGTYTLLVQLQGASADPLNSPSPQIGSTQKQIVVPAGYDETVPVELGEVTLERKKQQ